MVKIRKSNIIAIILGIVITIVLSSCGFMAKNYNKLTKEPNSQITELEDDKNTDKQDIKKENNNKEETKPETNTKEQTENTTKEQPPAQQQPTQTEQIQAAPPQPVSSSAGCGKYVVGYYASWASSYGYTPSDIDATKLTHINYAFANISSNNKLVLGNPSADVKNFEGLRNLKNVNPSLKLIISVGGWDYSTYFSNAALTAESRETFANSCVDFITKYGFDGIDLDWEYPVSGGMGGIINRPEDKQNFTKLIKAIRQKLDVQSSKDGKQYYLTVAGATTTSYLNNIELINILPYLDYIFIMAYDISGPWDKQSGFNAPLYNSNDGSSYSMSVDKTVKNYLNAGASSSKLVLGMPFYGYKYEVNYNTNNGINQPFSKASSISYNKLVKNYLDNPNYERFVHPNSKVPYIFGNNTFITYEDGTSISLKVNLAKEYGLAGVGIWELSHDSKGTLLSSTYNTLNS